MNTIIANEILNDQQIKDLEGKYLDESYIKVVAEDNTIILKPDGNPLAVFLKNCIPANIAKEAYYSLRKAISKSNNRGMASGELPKDLKVGDKFDGMTVGKITGNRFIPLKKYIDVPSILP